MGVLRALVSGDRPFVVFDTEFTAWPGSLQANWQRPGEYREIVQIGAVKLSASDLLERANLCILIRPRHNPQLSSYFTELTGITQNILDREGVDLLDALKQFSAFTVDAAAIVSNGSDGEVLLENCRLITVECPIDSNLFHNIRSELAELLGIDQSIADSSQLPAIIGRKPFGRAHDALADARGVVLAIRYASAILAPDAG
jgi:inhibitor of KinA sporulation pathway (predicted exonuclease)